MYRCIEHTVRLGKPKTENRLIIGSFFRLKKVFRIG